MAKAEANSRRWQKAKVEGKRQRQEAKVKG